MEKPGIDGYKKTGNSQECSNYRTIALISHASKITLQILLNRMREKIEMELPDEQAGVRPAGVTADMLVIIQVLIEKLWASEVKPLSLSLTTAKHCWIALVRSCTTF